jgi:hypothetical protein
MPAPDVNAANVIERVGEAHGLMLASQWEQFMFLYLRLASYHDTCIRKADEPISDDDLFTAAWHSLRLYAVEAILNRLAGSRQFDDFVAWLNRLAEIVSDPRVLWDVLHTEMQPSLKVTLEESDKIAAMFFRPDMRFEFDLDSFLQCPLCDLVEVKTMGRVIDVFYCLIGYIDSCHLKPDYVATAPSFVDFIDRLLLAFLQSRGFDPRRFVWMIEKMSELAHLAEQMFRAACARSTCTSRVRQASPGWRTSTG